MSEIDYKICKICGESKPISEYQKAGKGRYYQPYCKPCDSIRKKKYCELNKDKVLKKKKDYYYRNKDKIDEKNKKWYWDNKEKSLQYHKEYGEKNREEINRKSIEYRKNNNDYVRKRDSERRRKNIEHYLMKEKQYREQKTPEQKALIALKQKEWRIKNKEKIAERRKLRMDKIRETRRLNNNKRAATDISFKIVKNLRSRIGFALKRNIKKSDTTRNLLGCSIDYFKEYFQNKFNNGMTWELFMKGEIHIDHIIPCSKFDLTKEEEQRKCFHYTNLQPLWKLDNLRKGAFYEHKIAS